MYRQGEAVGEVGKKRRALLCWRTGGKQGPGLIPRAGWTKAANHLERGGECNAEWPDKYLATACSGWLDSTAPPPSGVSA
jgi:hypothetical protein